MKDLRNLKIKKVDATLLKETGDHLLNIVRFEFGNSFEKNFNHDVREDLKSLQEEGKLWIDPTPQLLITFGSTEGKGVISHRFNAKGYVKADDSDFDEEMLDRDDILVIKGYVCIENKDGLFERIEAPEKTEKALNILFGFFNKLGYTDEDTDIETALTECIDEKVSIVGSVGIDTYEDSERFVIEKFRAPREDEVMDTEDATPAVSKDDFVEK